MSAVFDVLIVGGGHAGAQAAIALRQKGFQGSVAIVTEDEELPYERPPLSKDYLARDKSFERILIRPAQFWQDKEVSLLLGRVVTGVDPERRVVIDNDDVEIGYVDLIWAAGGHARKLGCDGADLEGVHSVRSRRDVDRIIAELDKAKAVMVIGGGYIGLEAAAVLTKLGKTVAILEAQDRVLARVAGEDLSRFYEGEHRRKGVEIRLGAEVACVEGNEGRVVGVRLATGEVLDADLVIVGVGIIPTTAPLQAAGADCPNGVAVDAYCRTSLPHVYAIGDCAWHMNAFAGAEIRLESVQNAHDQAVTVANLLTGTDEPYHAAPWFWSNQYDLRLQTIGLSRGYDQTVLRGRLEDRSFSVIYLSDGRVIALDCVNASKDFVQGKALVVGGARPNPRALADPETPLKSLAASGESVQRVADGARGLVHSKTPSFSEPTP